MQIFFYGSFPKARDLTRSGPRPGEFTQDATSRLGLPACLEFPGVPGEHGGLGTRSVAVA